MLKKTKTLILRYITLLIIGFPNLFLFYYIFTPLTVYPVLFVLKFFSEAILLSQTEIYFNSILLEIIPACVAGSAYYFLLILNLTTPMNSKQRIISLLFMFLTFLLINILRIVSFSLLYVNGFSFFDLTHKITWYFGSTILLIIVWFANVKLFKIVSIPIKTDFQYLYKNIKPKK